jgi:hypothetical protein
MYYIYAHQYNIRTMSGSEPFLRTAIVDNLPFLLLLHKLQRLANLGFSILNNLGVSVRFV